MQTCLNRLAGDDSIGVIATDADIDHLHQRLRDDNIDAAHLGVDDNAPEAARVVCVPASLAKGLEFDTVIAVEPARIVAAEPRGIHRLYVVLTRAVSNRRIIHAEPLPGPLRHP